MKIVCLTADPEQTILYGLVYGYSSDNLQSRGYQRDVIILIKSQVNPSNVSDIQWSAVSTLTSSTSLTTMITHSNPQLACAVSSAGVFTAFSHGAPVNSGVLAIRTLRGIRYNPVGQMGPEYNVTGGGDWVAVDVSSRYNNTETPYYYSPVMFYLKEGEVETLVYAFSTVVDRNIYEPAIQLGYVNENPSIPILEPSTLYKNDILKIAKSDINLAYGNGNLYTYSSGPTPRLISIPLATSNTTAPTIKQFTADSTNNCQYEQSGYIHSGIWNNSYFLLCSHFTAANGYDLQLNIISSTPTDTKTSSVARYTGFIDKVQPGSFFQPIGGHLPGQEAFVAISFGTEIQGITLTGPSAGTRQSLTDVYVDGIHGDGTGDPNSRIQEEKAALSSIELTSIITAFVLVVLVASLIMIRRVRQRRKECIDPSKFEQSDSDSNRIQLMAVETRRTDAPIGTPNFHEAELNQPPTPSNNPNVMVLFRSRVNPKSLNFTQWSIAVTAIPLNTTVATDITRNNIFVACAADSVGVFTDIFLLYDGHMSAARKDSLFLLYYKNGVDVTDSLHFETINSMLTDNITTTLSKLSTDVNLSALTYPFFQPIGGSLPYQPAFAVLNGVLRIQDPEQTIIYGLVYGYSSDKQQSRGYQRDVIILIKSQANPSSISDIKWSVVSTFPSSTWLTPMITHSNPQLACAVSSDEVFTALSFGAPVNRGASAIRTFSGIRYNPVGQMGPEYGVTGGGVWVAVDISSRYNNTETPLYYRPVMFYLKEGELKTLAYAFPTEVGPKNEPAIQLGYVDEKPSTAVLEPSILYKKDTLNISDNSISIAYENGNLYAYAPRPIPRLLSIPISTSTTAKPTTKQFNVDSTNNCQFAQITAINSGTWNNSYFLLCNHFAAAANKYDPQLDTISSTPKETKTSPVARYSGSLEKAPRGSFFQPIGGHLPGQEAFAVISFETEIQGITLTGPSAGTRQNFMDVYVDGIYGDGDGGGGGGDGTVDSGDPNSRSNSVQDGKSSLSSPEWTAIIAAIFLVVFISGIFVIKKVRQRRKKRIDPSKFEQGDSDTNKIRLKSMEARRGDASIGRPNSQKVEVDGAVPLSLTGFSTHPRPNVITYIGPSNP
ncbi:MAG: hypothetical protein JOS17DRAFT_791172 [Linnemannia elongata]|nr:MAG: hypothetical protein JOS17DRAFT_791172 [Linnemannia elongata]